MQRFSHWLPRLAALAAAVVGLINIASTLTPNIRWRGHLLLNFEPVQAMRLFHALALPAGTALLLVAPYLLKRRRRAWRTAIVLMAALGAIDLLKGLDFEATAVTWATAAVLATGGASFQVRHDPISLRSAIWRVPLLGLAGVSVVALATWASQGHPSPATIWSETSDLLRWQAGPIHFEAHSAFHHHFAWIPLSVHLIEFGTLLAMAYVVFRPLAAPRTLPGPGARAEAAALVRACGHRHPVVLQAPLRRAVSLQYRRAGVRRLPDRESCAAAVRRSGRTCSGCPSAARRGSRLCGRARAAAGGSRRQRDPAARCTRSWACAPCTSVMRRSSIWRSSR